MPFIIISFHFGCQGPRSRLTATTVLATPHILLFEQDVRRDVVQFGSAVSSGSYTFCSIKGSVPIPIAPLNPLQTAGTQNGAKRMDETKVGMDGATNHCNFLIQDCNSTQSMNKYIAYIQWKVGQFLRSTEILRCGRTNKHLTKIMRKKYTVDPLPPLHWEY